MFGDEVAREKGEGFAELREELAADEVTDSLFFFIVRVDVDFELEGFDI